MRDYKYFSKKEQMHLSSLEGKDMEAYRKAFLEYSQRELDWNLLSKHSAFGYFLEEDDDARFYGVLQKYEDGVFFDHNGVPFHSFTPIKADMFISPYAYEQELLEKEEQNDTQQKN